MIRRSHSWTRQYRWDSRRTAAPQLAVGIFIMAFGVLLMLDRLQIMEVTGALRYWPLGLVALGATILVRRQDAHGRYWGFGWMFLGAWLLLNTLGLVRIGIWQLFWPIVMVFVGVSLIRQSMSRKTPLSPGDSDAVGSSDASDGTANLFAMMSESKGSVTAETLRGAKMTAFMGGCMLDLRQAMLPPGAEAVVDVLAIMGGLELWVPSGWTVTTDVASIMAAVDDKRLPAIAEGLAPGQAPPRLLLRGVVVMSGLTVKS